MNYALNKKSNIIADLEKPSEIVNTVKFDINYIWVGLLMLAILLRFPWVLIFNMHDVPYRPVIQMVTHAGVGMIAVAMLLTNLHWFKIRFGWIPIALISIIFISTGLHAFIDQETAIFEMTALVAVPLLCALNYKIVMKLLPWYIGLFWFVNALETLQYYGWYYSQPDFATFDFPQLLKHWWNTTNDAVGMPGNRNWQASFLVGSTPFAMWGVWRAMKAFFSDKEWIWLFVAAQIPVVAVSFMIFQSCDSRGATLAFFAAIILTAFLFVMRQFRANRVKQNRILLTTVGAIVLLGALTFVAFNKRICYEAEKLNITDVRIPMWTAATRMIFETQNEVKRDAVFTPPGMRWLFGGGCEYFEDQYVTYRAANYFCRPLPASRTDYPHNFTFYTLGAMGIPAGLAFLGLVLASFFIVYRRLMYMEEFDSELAIVLWMCFVFYVHTQLDLVLEYWPMCGFFLLGLGCLWYRAFKHVELPNVEGFKDSILHKNSTMLAVRFIGLALGLGMFIWAGKTIYKETMFHLHEREAMIYSDIAKELTRRNQKEARNYYAKADREYRMALEYKPVMEVAYLALTNASWSALGDPRRMDLYLDYIKNRAKRFNYCNVPQIAAYRAHEEKQYGKFEELLRHQTTIYPIGTSYWFAYHDALLMNGKVKEAKKAMDIAKYTMHLKGFEPTQENINQFRNNPGFDLTGKGEHYMDRKVAQLQLEYFGKADTQLLKNPIPWPSMHNPIVPPGYKLNDKGEVVEDTPPATPISVDTSIIEPAKAGTSHAK